MKSTSVEGPLSQHHPKLLTCGQNALAPRGYFSVTLLGSRFSIKAPQAWKLLLLSSHEMWPRHSLQNFPIVKCAMISYHA